MYCGKLYLCETNQKHNNMSVLDKTPYQMLTRDQRLAAVKAKKAKKNAYKAKRKPQVKPTNQTT